MDKIQVRYWITIALLVLALTVNLGIRYGLGLKQEIILDLQEIPREIAGWQEEEEIELDDKIYKILDPDGLIYRSYKNDSGYLIWLIVQYHLNDRYGAHDPLICHVSQGWKPVYVDDREIKVVSPPGLSHALNHFIVEKAGQQKLVFFWFFDYNGEETPSRSKMMFNNLKPRLLRRNAISGFVEVSTIGSYFREEDMTQEVYTFIHHLKPHIRSVIQDATPIDGI